MDTGSGLASVENLKQQQNFGHHFQVAVYRQQQDKDFHYMYIYALAATYFVVCCYATRIIEAGGDSMAMGCYGNQQQTYKPTPEQTFHASKAYASLYVCGLVLGHLERVHSVLGCWNCLLSEYE